MLLKSLAEKVRDDGKEYITIYYGEDVKEKHAQKAADIFADICPNADVNLLNGGQPGILLSDLRRITRKRKNNTEADLPAALRAAADLSKVGGDDEGISQRAA